MKNNRLFASALLLAFSCSAAFAQNENPAELRIVDGADLPMYKIVNGYGSLEFAQPSVAMVRDQAGALCSGTLIGCRTVLTAANCFCTDPASGLVLNGQQCQNDQNLLNPNKYSVYFQHGGVHAVEKITINPGFLFQENQEQGDVALIRLAEVVDGVPPTPINRLARPASGSPGKIVGFGRDSNVNDLGLKRTGSVIVENCTTVPAAKNLCWNFADPIGAPGTDSNSCDGDAGGPMLADFGTGSVVAGVMASGTSADCTAPDQAWNTDVAAERNWIEVNGGPDINRTRCGDLPQATKSGAVTLGASGTLNAQNQNYVASFDVPANIGLLRLAVNGEEFTTSTSPDFDLYITAGAPASENDYDCASENNGLVEFCEVQSPDATKWHVLVKRRTGAARFQIAATYFAKAASVCTPGPAVLCINDQPNDRRFRVTLDYASPSRSISGQGKAIATNAIGIPRGGLFWFFSSDNPEVLVKVLNGCAINGHYWVFLTAGTDVGYTVSVTDTTNGVQRTYSNPDLRAALPDQDLEAFSCN